MTKLECRDVFARLSEYIDGELPEDLCEEMSGHIGACAPCVDFVRSLEKTVALSRQLDHDKAELPAATREDLREAYRKFRQARGLSGAI